MHEELTNHAAQLRDTSKGWVYRRDSADYLGKAVEKAVDALRAAATDRDVDVKTAAERALGSASAVLAGIAPAASSKPYTLQQLAEACAKPGRRDVERSGDTYVVTVQLKNSRAQRVVVQSFSRSDGANLIQIITYCGPFDESKMSWALKTNTQLARCAIGVGDLGGQSQFVLVNCIPAAVAQPEEVKNAVKEIAFYGDWIEKKLTGGDNL